GVGARGDAGPGHLDDVAQGIREGRDLDLGDRVDLGVGRVAVAVGLGRAIERLPARRAGGGPGVRNRRRPRLVGIGLARGLVQQALVGAAGGGVVELY